MSGNIGGEKQDKMKHLLFSKIIIIIFLTGCKQDLQWNNLEVMYYIEEDVKNFKTLDASSLLKYHNYYIFDKEKVKAKFSKSKHIGNSELWKGGTVYAIAKFKDIGIIKLELSSNYGVYNIIDYESSYKIEGDEVLRRGRWEELLQE